MPAVQTERTLGVFVVEPHILRRIIRRHRSLSGLGLGVVHGHVYTLPRADLRGLVRPGELPPESDLPDHPILLPADTAPERAWRLIFHARVHQAIESRQLSPAVLRQRIHGIGQTEFDEIRYVLRSDDLLLPPRDDAETYVEFAALYLELKHFAPDKLVRTFPTLRDLAAIDKLLALDVDVPATLQASRPADAPRFPVPEIASAPSARPLAILVPDPTLVLAADSARGRGNLAHSAVHAIGAGTIAAARADLERLAARAGLPEPPRAAEALLPVARAAAVDHGARTPPLRFLYDLQKAAVDLERDTLEVGLAKWLLTLGRRPLVRALPAGREVRHARRLEHAQAKLARLELPDAEIHGLSAFLERAAAAAELRARTALRPEIEHVLNEVGLDPKNLPEAVAREKLVAELLDGILARGGFGLGDLRDGLSRNQLKLPSLSGFGELVRGDPLLRADHLLDDRLGGVYRGGEIYLRALQKLSSIFFGTATGRFLTLYAILPALAAYVLLEGTGHIVALIARHAFHARNHIEIYSPLRCAILAVYFFALLHVPVVRTATYVVGRFCRRVLHAVFVIAPRALWRTPALRALARSHPIRFVGRFLVKPAFFGGIILGLAHLLRTPTDISIIVAFVGFVCANIVANSQVGVRLEEITGDAFVRAGRHIGKRIIPGIVRLFLDIFKALLEYLDRAIYAVDEALRFRRGDPRIMLVMKALFGTVWAVIAYVIRICVNLFIEPTVNPIKHFPIVTVSAKIMWSFSHAIIAAMRSALLPFLGKMAASSLATATILFLPGFFGFLAWELAGNWRLYAKNRKPELRAEPFGHHGETLASFLRPGLHSGTIPKTYARLRRAVWRGAKEATRYRETLDEIGERISRFADREFAALLDRAPGWTAPITIHGVEIGSNRVRLELARGAERATVTFEEQSGWLVAGIAEPGFVAGLDARESQLFTVALLGLYKRAGVDLIRESIAARLPPKAAYDVGADGLVVWENDWTAETTYPLDPDQDDRWFFSQRPILWSAWVDFWSSAQDGLTRSGDPLTLLSR